MCHQAHALNELAQTHQSQPECLPARRSVAGAAQVPAQPGASHNSPQTLRKTLTYDQGKEMARHAELTLATGMAVYFCDPHSPWQRGTTENTNGLIRDFFPKGTDFATVSAQKLNFVQPALNERPRKTLGWKTPKNAINQLLNQAQLDALAS